MSQLSLRSLGLSQAEKDILDKLFISEEQCILPQVSQLDGFEKGSEKWQQLRCCYLGSSHFHLVLDSPEELLKKYESFTADPMKAFVKDQRELEWDNFHLEEDVLKSKQMFCMEGLPFLVCTPDYTAVHREKRHFEYIIEAFPVVDESLFPEKLPRSVRKKTISRLIIMKSYFKAKNMTPKAKILFISIENTRDFKTFEVVLSADDEQRWMDTELPTLLLFYVKKVLPVFGQSLARGTLEPIVDPREQERVMQAQMIDYDEGNDSEFEIEEDGYVRRRRGNTLVCEPITIGEPREGISVTNTSGMWGTMQKEIMKDKDDESRKRSYDGRSGDGTYFRWMVKFNNNAKKSRYNENTMHLPGVESRREPSNEGDTVLITSASKNMARKHLGNLGKIVKINNDKVFVKLDNGGNLSCHMKHLHLVQDTVHEEAKECTCKRVVLSKKIQSVSDVMRPNEVILKVKYS